MRIVCTHVKGGVGKSTTAIHAVGALLAEGSVALIDGDQAATSYRFFREGAYPEGPAPARVDGYGHDLWVASARADAPGGLAHPTRALREHAPEHIVADTTPRLTEISQIVTELRPDVILVSVKRHDTGSLEYLPDVLEAMRQLRAVGVVPQVRIVPIGLGPEAVEPYLAGAQVDVRIEPTMPFMDDIGEAVFGPRGSRFVWEIPGRESLFDAYRALVAPV